jgi:hypothetical protein
VYHIRRIGGSHDKKQTDSSIIIVKNVEWRKYIPENLISNTAVSLLSYPCMFQVEICSQQLEICKSVLANCCGDWLTFGCFVPMIADHDLVTKS